MARYDYDFAIIGGGSAGLTAAAGAARLGLKTLLVESEGRLGGDCLHYGCVPSKTLIATARTRRLMGRAAEFGLPAVPLGPVDFRTVRERIRAVIGAIQAHDSPERFRALGAETLFGAARFEDDHTATVNGRRISAGRWLVATGSSPAVPPTPGLDEVGFLTNRELFSLDRLPASLAVLGAGPVAVEMGLAFARLGTRVTLVQRSGQILSQADRDMADAVMERLRTEGVAVLLNATVRRAERRGTDKVLALETAGAPGEVAAEEILVAVGRRPNVAGLGLERAGVEADERGVRVDARLRTSRPHIFAAGDVLGRHLFTHAAAHEAGVVLANVAFRLPRRVSYDRMPWCVYGDPELASIGLTEKRAAERGMAVRTVIRRFRDNDRALAEGEPEGWLKLVLDGRGRTAGVQILGARAGDLIGEWAAVLAGRVSLSRLAAAVHPYPTLAEISPQAAGDVVGKRLFSGAVRTGLRLLFGYRGGRP